MSGSADHQGLPTSPGGLLPGVDLSNNGALLDLMDEWDRREKDVPAESQ